MFLFEEKVQRELFCALCGLKNDFVTQVIVSRVYIFSAYSVLIKNQQC